jgi:serine/threonine protein kinase
MIGETIRQYRIIKELNPGSGAMGDVFLAEHIFLPKRYAIKVLKPQLTGNPQFHERFFREAYEQSLLNHPNIVQSVDFFEEGGRFFFVMEFISGQDLGRRIYDKGKLPETEALPILTGILEGLKHAHDKRIVHRDIKPSNILIEEDGTPRIADFGIALLQDRERLTETGIGLGTSCYMSPEQIQRPKAVDSRSDIYSAGILLYEMLTGDVPFDGETDFSIKQQHIFSDAPNPRLKVASISENLVKIIHKAMAKNPEDRFQNCAEFLERIRTYQDSRKDSNLERHHHFPGSNIKKSYWIWLGALAIAALFFLFYIKWPLDAGENISNQPQGEQPDQSIARIEKAKTEDITDQRELGLRYLNGQGVARNSELALSWLTKAADSGDPVAQYEIGAMYDYGNGVARDSSIAERWYQKSAEQGNPKAQNSLGDLYYNGEGIPVNFQQAHYWYQRAAEQGNRDAQNNLGETLLLGKGAPVNLAEGVNWIRKSAEQGYARAQKNLGDLFLAGKGVEKNFAQAMIWYQRAAAQGDADAKAVLEKNGRQ